MAHGHDQLFHSLHQNGLLMLANCWDGGSARMALAAGSKALATSSAAVAWAHGYADGSRLPVALLKATVYGILRVSPVPLTVDIEDGYSNDPAIVAQLVKELVEAGVVGINIEDGADADLLARKIAAIRQVVETSGVKLFINARCDVYLRGLAPENERVAETLRRARLYEAAGASGLFAAGVQKEDEIAAIAAGTPLPLNVLARVGLAAPDRLQVLGVRRLSAGSAPAEAMHGYVLSDMKHFLATGEIRTDPPAFDYGTLNRIMAG